MFSFCCRIRCVLAVRLRTNGNNVDACVMWRPFRFPRRKIDGDETQKYFRRKKSALCVARNWLEFGDKKIESKCDFAFAYVILFCEWRMTHVE